MDSLRKSLAPLVPPSTPWGLLAAAVALYSLFLLLLSLLASHDQRMRLVTQEMDVFYNFGTAALWFIESALQTLTAPLCYRQSWAFWVGWALSALLMGSSVQALYIWQWTDESMTTSAIVAFITMVAYAWLAICWYGELRSRGNYQAIVNVETLEVKNTMKTIGIDRADSETTAATAVDSVV